LPCRRRRVVRSRWTEVSSSCRSSLSTSGPLCVFVAAVARSEGSYVGWVREVECVKN
jgi:hypothetical protein